MVKHTPAPWKIHRWRSSQSSGVTSNGLKNGIWNFEDDAAENIFRIVAGTEHLGKSNTMGSFEGCHIADLSIKWDGEDEAEANARLIAAAPELLTACQLARQLLTEYGDSCCIGGGIDLRVVLGEAIEKALAKSTAEEGQKHV